MNFPNTAVASGAVVAQNLARAHLKCRDLASVTPVRQVKKTKARFPGNRVEMSLLILFVGQAEMENMPRLIRGDFGAFTNE